jgi:pimeloyl-ACP methyl ester carboxylesterase
MTSNEAVQTAPVIGSTRDLVFAGDGVLLAGQIDYPATKRPAGGYPLVFMLPNAGCNTRQYYAPYAHLALETGYAVFRWDKRGTGHSGAAGRGSTTQDAVNAYQTALDQPFIDPHHVTLIAEGAGTGMLGSSFGLFARVQHPTQVILISNLLDDNDILAIDAPIRIIMNEEDWNSWEVYGEAACSAHNRTYKHGATFYVARKNDRAIRDVDGNIIHSGVRKALRDWLTNTHPTSRLI